MKATTIVTLERHLRKPITHFLPPKLTTSIYSNGRQTFLKRLNEDIPKIAYIPPEDLSTELWEIEFRSPIINAAGLFKNGECYEVSFRQGAGGFLGGTTTYNKRSGKIWDDGNGKTISQPFVPYPRSHSSSNSLALPNDGDATNSFKVFTEFEKREGFPIIWSLMADPDTKGEIKLENLVKGMVMYDQARVDVLEINVSCPNVAHSDEYDKFETVLEYVSDNFLKHRIRNLPVVVKFSNDTNIYEIPYIMDLLFKLRFDGVNFGNTSIDYKKHRDFIHPNELKLFDFFTSEIGGGISGAHLKKDSFDLCMAASKYKKKIGTVQEFHIIRTGGIETWEDIDKSIRKGDISLCQWLTGYNEGFADHKHKVYQNLYPKPK